MAQVASAKTGRGEAWGMNQVIVAGLTPHDATEPHAGAVSGAYGRKPGTVASAAARMAEGPSFSLRGGGA